MGYQKQVAERDTSLIDEGWYEAKLIDVKPKQVGQGTKLKWKFQILEGEYADRWVWGECWDNLDQGDGCVWRRWHEALVDRPVGIGENIDTDDVVNMLALVQVKHRSYEKDGEEKWLAEVPEDPTAVRPVGSEVPASGDPWS